MRVGTYAWISMIKTPDVSSWTYQSRAGSFLRLSNVVVRTIVVLLQQIGDTFVGSRQNRVRVLCISPKNRVE